MVIGLSAGILWGLDTVVLGVALAMSPFFSTEQAIFLAPFVSTFLHDLFSALWMMIYMGARRQLKRTWRALKTRSGKFIVLGALLGGPVGMSGYVSAINYIGPTYTAIISAMFPALGVFFAHIFLKEKMSGRQLAGLAVSILGVIGLGYMPGEGGGVTNLALGFFCALLCVVGWASEAVICAYGMKDPEVGDENALQIRQTTSAIFYGLVILPVLSGWKFTLEVSATGAMPVIIVSALFGTASYVCYYKAIHNIGPSRAMALNITYSAWAIAFEFILLQHIPTLQSIVCGAVVIGGSLTAARPAGQAETLLQE